MSGSTGTPREKMLEKKIVTLEQRLNLVERFVGMRFCESFKDFATRNLKKGPIVDKKRSNNATGKRRHDDDDTLEDDTMDKSQLSSLGHDAEDEEAVTTCYLTRSGRKSTRFTAAAMGYKASKTEEDTKGKIIVKTCPTSDVESDRDADFVTIEDSFSVLLEQNDNDELGVDDENILDDDYQVDMEYDEEENFSAGGDNDEEFQPKRKSSNSGSRKQRKKIRGGKVGGSNVNVGRPMPKSARLRMLKQTGTSTKECPLCHEHLEMDKFDEHMFSVHVNENKNNSVYKCSFCDKGFSQLGMLNRHEKTHQVDKYGHKCRICEKMFSNKSILAHERGCIQKHLKADQPVDAEVMEDVRRRSARFDLNWPDPNEVVPTGMKKCSHCKELVNEENLLAHIREQHADFKCTICSNAYVHKHGLRRHMSSAHKGIKMQEQNTGQDQSDEEEIVEEYDEEEEDMLEGVSTSGENEDVQQTEPPESEDLILSIS